MAATSADNIRPSRVVSGFGGKKTEHGALSSQTGLKELLSQLTKVLWQEKWSKSEPLCAFPPRYCDRS